MVEVATPDMLDCNNSLPFWLEWAGGHIKVGTGRVSGGAPFMEYEDVDPYDVRVVAPFTSTGFTGRWWFRQKNGRPNKFNL